MTKIEKKKYITLAITENIADLLLGLMNSIGSHGLRKVVDEMGISKEAEEFLEEFSNSTHHAGWCKDPTCIFDFKKDEKK